MSIIACTDKDGEETRDGERERASGDGDGGTVGRGWGQGIETKQLRGNDMLQTNQTKRRVLTFNAPGCKTYRITYLTIIALHYCIVPLSIVCIRVPFFSLPPPSFLPEWS